MGRNIQTFGEVVLEGAINQDGVNVMLRDLNLNAFYCAGASTAPSGKAHYAVGCTYVNMTTGAKYVNTGSITSCTFVLQSATPSNTITTAMLMANVVTSGKIDTGVIQVDKVSISAANIISGTTMKQLVAAPAAGSYLELLSCTLAITFGTAAYTGGGNVSIALGTTPITGIISNANSFGKGSNAVIQFNPLAAAATDISALTATALNINVASGAFTNPGTAAGTAVAYVAYRILTTT
jgi:hypothetical protein